MNVQDAINELDSEKMAITSTPQFSYVYIKDGISEPDAVADRAVMYVDSADGDLKVKFSNGYIHDIVHIG
jgi:hypothetical protein